jgi:phage gp36-like protein
MPNYATAAELVDLIPSELLTEAADDNADGTADTGRLDSLLTAAERVVNGLLSRRYRVPIDVTTGGTGSPADFLKHCTLYLAAQLAYARRSMEKQFPHQAMVDSIVTELRDIANGIQPLFPETKQVNTTAEIISEPSRVYSSQASA